ncbi:MAG: hypothetical protein HQ478_12995 [Chloroflexi bacterium]|nr:hypothetical protein [Chloroflexota bacterium]
MSVDTYARKVSLKAYRKFESKGVEILVAKSLAAQAEMVRLDLKKFLFWKWLSVSALLAGHGT